MPLKEGKSDEEDEIVSFEAFCHDTAAGDTGKSDALTLNDNVNYHLFYENRDQSGEEALNNQGFKETSLSGLSQKFAHKRNVPKFYQPGGRCAFLGRFNNNSSARSATTADDEGYQRFSTNRGAWSQLPKIGSGVLIILIVCILCVAVWWGVWGIVGGPWGEEHYRRLWEKAHPNHNQQTHYSPSVIVHQQLERLDTLEPKYHDHNNLSTKNKASALENGKKQKIEIVRKNIALLGGLDISDTPPVPDRKQCKVVLDDLKFDCFPQGTATEEACKDRGCCWMPPTQYSLNYQLPQGTLGIPYCFYPPNYASYKYVNITEDDRGIHALLQRQFRSPYSNDIDLVKLEIEFLAYPGMRMKLYDAEKARYEPPYPEVAPPRFKHNSWAVRVEIDPLKMGFKVIRKVDNTTIFNTQNIGGFIFSDKFLQISSLLPSENIYGLGEHRARFPLNIQWQKFTLFNHDTRPNENTNLYGSHPFYLIMEHSGLSHGVLLLNSNAMDVILQPAPAITFRTIGGILDFFLFHGTTPKDVVAQFTYLVGRPVMPNYWALGFHLCKYNYGSLNETREVWKRNVDAGIPFDVQWNDIDYMNNSNDFTYDKVLYADLPKFVEEVHKIGMHYVPIIDAGVSAAEIPGTYPPYDRGLDMNIFIKHQNGLPFVGKVWNKASTVWPDFTHPNSSEYWLEMLKNLHNDIPFDGIWLDMNEPSNFLSGPLHGSCAPENLEYMPGIAGGNGLRSGTICMEAEHYLGSHYNLHNIHSLTEVVATEYALSEIMPQRRPFIISRSSFIGLGLYGGHWSGDNYSDWYDMKMSIPEMLMFSLFGVPLMGSDICGFGGNTTAELCMRWMELGAFYPFSRNHNTETGLPQDPVAMGPEVVAASKRALRIRYTLLPYLYTLFWKVHEYGETVASPTFFVFPKDRETYELDQQFMWGEEILIAPILDPGVKSVRAYLPDYTWYRFNGLSRIKKTGWVTLNEGETVMLKGAVVYIMQEPPNYGPVNTQTTRSQPMQLVVALHKLNANGMLYWDDGENPRAIQEGKYSRIHFYAQNNFMSNQVIWWGYGVPPISRISFLSVRMPAVKYVYINNDTHTNFTFDPIAKVLHVIDLNLDMNKHFTISYHDGKDRHVYNPPLGWKPDYE